MPALATTTEGVPPAPINASTLDPATVTTMVEVRIGIDDLDRRIVTLLGNRMRYIEAAARIKPSRNTVRDEWRKQDVITKVANTAVKVDFPPQLARNIYEVLVEGSIAHEFVKFDAREEQFEDAEETHAAEDAGHV